MEFVGKSLALGSGALSAAASDLQTNASEVWAVLGIETSGCGFLPDRRPQLLFERHVFHELTEGRYDADPDISNQTPGGYGEGGAHQYERLNKAILKNRPAALQSASWGLGQLMGHNYRVGGYSDVEEMVSKMADSEGEQLTGMVQFIKQKRLDGALSSHDWATFARGYNGAGYYKHQYDARLKGEFQKYSYGPLPDLDVRTAQLDLTFLGFHPGPVDGNLGPLTESALSQFRHQQGLAASESITAQDLTRLAYLVSQLP